MSRFILFVKVSSLVLLLPAVSAKALNIHTTKYPGRWTSASRTPYSVNQSISDWVFCFGPLGSLTTSTAKVRVLATGSNTQSRKLYFFCLATMLLRGSQYSPTLGSHFTPACEPLRARKPDFYTNKYKNPVKIPPTLTNAWQVTALQLMNLVHQYRPNLPGLRLPTLSLNTSPKNSWSKKPFFLLPV